MGSTPWIAVILLLGVLGATQTDGAVSARMVSITHRHILELMQSEPSFSATRHPLPLNNISRDPMRKFIKEKFGQMAGELGGIANGHVLEDFHYSTKTFDDRREARTITGTNIVLTLKGSKGVADDRPLMILANYDTDSSGNVVEDNGSGVAALLVVGDYFTKQVKDEKIKLEHSVIFVASDTSIRKYQANSGGIPDNSTSGADQIAKEFLPTFMRDRKEFRGVIVLDSLLNFKNESRSQIVDAGGFDRSYPEAYTEMAKENFPGDFLALVARDTDLDKGLKESIEAGWKRALIQPKSQGGTPPSAGQIDARLISFVKKPTTPNTDAVFEFAKSEQSSIWNHHERPEMAQYPAVLLTDTRVFRVPICTSPNCNYLEASTDQRNLAFIHRTMMTLHYVLRGQTDSAPDGASSLQSSLLMITPLLALTLRYALALNA